MRLDGNAIGALGARLRSGSVLVSATNGKTTTAAMAASIFERAGIALVYNQAGANMAGGVATSLLTAARPHGRMSGELGLFEVDELWLDSVSAQLHPRAVLLGNLFRDQLDRYGELEAILESWERALGQSPSPEPAGMAGAPRSGSPRLILNADDPLLADLGRSRPGVLYFGVDDDSLALSRMAHAADAKHCRRCGAAYLFDAVYLGHLGHYRCPSCGQQRPVPTVTATHVTLRGVHGASFMLHSDAGEAEVTLALPGLYNVYNALAAAALATALEVDLKTIVAGLASTRAAFGRGETVTLSLGQPGRAQSAPPVHRELRILLVKNPAGANEVLRTLTMEPGEHDLLGVLNDNIADGRDVSWIWDVDFELLVGRVRRVRCSGTRAAELAVRLKYAGIDPQRILVQSDLELALREAADDRVGTNSPLYALPTYTAMLSLRELLVARGEVQSAWS